MSLQVVGRGPGEATRTGSGNNPLGVSEAEWGQRVDLAACYRLVSHFGMTDLVYNHITARVPSASDAEPERLLINAYGLLYDEITASNLLTIDIDGNVVANAHSQYGVNQAGYVIHGAIHEARPDVGCVIHTHTRAGMAVSAMSCGLLPLTQTAMRFADITYHDYEGPAIDLDERKRLVADLGSGNAMILRNHGLLVTGPTVAQAFNTLYWLEMACKAQVDVMASGAQPLVPSDAVVERTWRLYQPEVRRPFGEMEWPAMLRLLDRKDPSYRS